MYIVKKYISSIIKIDAKESSDYKWSTFYNKETKKWDRLELAKKYRDSNWSDAWYDVSSIPNEILPNNDESPGPAYVKPHVTICMSNSDRYTKYFDTVEARDLEYNRIIAESDTFEF